MMTTKAYAQALYALFQESPRATLGKDFVEHLTKNGKLALLPGIIRALEKIEAQKLRATTCEISVAHEADLHGALGHAKTFIHEHGGESGEWTFQEKVDSSLIGGYRIRTPERELDMSDKRGLYRLYETLRSAA
jgi:F0F1-type ATP synthase delta subunit